MYADYVSERRLDRTRNHPSFREQSKSVIVVAVIRRYRFVSSHR